eukprot:12933114-Prorocentrum_lima.AAC.1
MRGPQGSTKQYGPGRRPGKSCATEQDDSPMVCLAHGCGQPSRICGRSTSCPSTLQMMHSASRLSFARLM